MLRLNGEVRAVAYGAELASRYRLNNHTASWYRSFGCRIPFTQLCLANICGNWTSESQKIGSDIHRLTYPVAIHWLPLAKDISRLINLAKLANLSEEPPTVYDVGCGTGLLPYLLAQTNEVKAVGIDPDFELVLGSGINHPSPSTNPQPEEYKHPNLALYWEGAYDLSNYLRKPPEVVISSFMPYELDLTGAIALLNPKVIVYIIGKDSGLDLEEQTAYLERYKPKPGYREALSWQGPSSLDVLRFFGYINYVCDLKPSIPQIPEPRDRLVRVHVADQVFGLLSDRFSKIDVLECSSSLDRYPWESEDLESIVGADRFEILKRGSKVTLAEQALSNLLTVDSVKFEI